MNVQSQTAPGAKVLAFPIGGRRGIERMARFAALENDNRPTARVIVDSWYHEAALAEDTTKKS